MMTNVVRASRVTVWVGVLAGSALLAASAVAQAQNAEPGRQVFASRCATCHGTEGGGGELGPVDRRRAFRCATTRSSRRSSAKACRAPACRRFRTCRTPRPATSWRFLRTLKPRAGTGPQRTTVTPWATAARWPAWCSTRADGRDAAARRRPRAAPAARDDRRPLPRGDVADRVGRPTTATRTATATARSRRSRRRTRRSWRRSWMFTPAERRAAAGDAGGGGRRDVRHQPPTISTRSTPAAAARSGITGGRARAGWSAWPARGVNRGVAVAGDRVFMATDHAHLIALNRATGALLWETRDGRLAPELQRHRRADGRWTTW